MQKKGKLDKVLVTGVIGEDVHVTGIRILEHALRSEGFEVHSLGIHNTREDFIREARRVKADVILVSSLTGHAKMLVAGFKEKCDAAGLEDVLLYIGGHLVLNAEEWCVTEAAFRELGFNRVCRPFTLPDTVIGHLYEDLAIAGRGEATA